MEEQKRRDNLLNTHRKEMAALENAHKAETKELLSKWNNVIMPNFENETNLLELELKKRHQTELEEFKTSIEQGTYKQQKLHYSTEILDMVKKKEYLSSQGAYMEAKLLQKKIKKLKAVEKDKHESLSKQKLMNKS